MQGNKLPIFEDIQDQNTSSCGNLLEDIVQVFVMSPLSSQLFQAGTRLDVRANLFGVNPERDKDYVLEV
jgi:hypothetical protein